MTRPASTLPKRRTVSLKEAAAALGVHPATAYRLAARDGQLCEGVPVHRIGRSLRIGATALDRIAGKLGA